jgi:hypothetical protein
MRTMRRVMWRAVRRRVGSECADGDAAEDAVVEVGTAGSAQKSGLRPCEDSRRRNP